MTDREIDVFFDRDTHRIMGIVYKSLKSPDRWAKSIIDEENRFDAIMDHPFSNKYYYDTHVRTIFLRKHIVKHRS